MSDVSEDSHIVLDESSIPSSHYWPELSLPLQTWINKKRSNLEIAQLRTEDSATSFADYLAYEFYKEDTFQGCILPNLPVRCRAIFFKLNSNSALFSDVLDQLKNCRTTSLPSFEATIVEPTFTHSGIAIFGTCHKLFVVVILSECSWPST